MGKMGGGGRRSPPPPNGGGGKSQSDVLGVLGGGKGKGKISSMVGGVVGGANGGGGALGGMMKGKVSGKVGDGGYVARCGDVGGKYVKETSAIVDGERKMHGSRALGGGNVGKMVAKDGGANSSSLFLAKTRSGKVWGTPLFDGKGDSSFNDGGELAQSGESLSVDVTLGTNDTREDYESIVDGETETSSEEDEEDGEDENGDDVVVSSLQPSCRHGRLSSSSSPILLKEKALSPTLRAIFGIGSNHEVQSKLMKQTSSTSPSHVCDPRFGEGRSSPNPNAGFDGVKGSIIGGEDDVTSLENVIVNVGVSVLPQKVQFQSKSSSFSAWLDEKSNFSVLAGISGGVAVPAAQIPATMEVSRPSSSVGMIEDDGDGVQSVAMLSSPPINVPNNAKILNHSHNENSSMGAAMVHSSLQSQQEGNSNMGVNKESLLGPPPSSPLNIKVPSHNGWRRKPKFENLPKVPCLAEISKDGASVCMDEDSSSANVERLACALVGKALGRPLPFQLLKSELKKNWSRYGNFKLSILSCDTFICMFESREVRDSIILGGPWFASNQLLALDCWSETFDPKLLGGFSSPTWIRLPQLPLHYWDKVNLSRIGSMLGDPLFVDETTMTWSRTEFARICIRLDFAKKLPKGIWIEGKHRRFFQQIFYEGLPKICFSCGHIGHAETNCPLPPIPPPATLASPPIPPAAIEVPPPIVTPPKPPLQPILDSAQSFLNLTHDSVSRPSMDVAEPKVGQDVPLVPIEEPWVLKRNRKHGSKKIQKKLYLSPWRRFVKSKGPRIQHWKVVKGKDLTLHNCKAPNTLPNVELNGVASPLNKDKDVDDLLPTGGMFKVLAQCDEEVVEVNDDLVHNLPFGCVHNMEAVLVDKEAGLENVEGLHEDALRVIAEGSSLGSKKKKKGSKHVVVQGPALEGPSTIVGGDASPNGVT